MKEENVKSEYQRKVDKSLIPTCNIMGVNIAAINMNWLLKYIDENLSDNYCNNTICSYLVYFTLFIIFNVWDTDIKY